MKTRICAAGLILLCLLTLSGCGSVRPSPEVQLTVSGCPRVTQCRLERSAPRNNGDLNAVLDETEAAWAVCADKVDTIIACQERDSEQTAVLTQRPE
ncbi:Rz1-like lysis system protein LysC [Citrobacter freundii]|nr:Rz1-like lysis system protein LysC [Citrobacter freundii]